MIREANREDCVNLAALTIEVYLNTYAKNGIRSESSKYVVSTFTEDYFSGLLIDSKYRILVHTKGIYLRGFALINLESIYENEENGFEIDKLYVHSMFQGKGIGLKLLKGVKQRYGSRFWLNTWVNNKYQIAFYRKFGFKDIGEYNFELGGILIENRILVYGGT